MQLNRVLEAIIEAPVFAIVFGTWLILSIAAQFFRTNHSRIRIWDHCGLLPSWNFFAPEPGTLDYSIMYRDILPGKFGPWKTLTETTRTGGISAIWNQHMIGNKVLHDWIQSLIEIEAATPYPELLKHTWPYQVILFSIMNDKPVLNDSLRQFSIVASTNYSPKIRKIIFISDGHKHNA